MSGIPRYDFEVIQDDTFQITLFVVDDNDVPIDITGWYVEMPIMSSHDCDGSDIVQQLSTTNGSIVLNGPLGQIDITMTPAESLALPADIYSYRLKTIDTLLVAKTRFGGLFTIVAQD
jgi:hypothetical protein